MLDSKLLQVDLCLPVYNEEIILADNVERIISFLDSCSVKLDVRLVILVNGSSDGSAVIAQQLASKYPERIIYREYSIASKGQALLAYVNSSPADYWGFIDIDLAVDLPDLESMFNLIIAQEADLIIASRFLPGAFRNRQYLRELISVTYNRLARLLLRTKVSDHQCGCKFVSQAWWQKIRWQIKPSDWFLDTEMIAWTSQFGGCLIEAPVHWVDNRYSCRPTKVRLWRDSCRFILELFSLKKRLKANG